MKKKDFNFLAILVAVLCIIAIGIAWIRKRGK